MKYIELSTFFFFGLVFSTFMDLHNNYMLSTSQWQCAKYQLTGEHPQHEECVEYVMKDKGKEG